MSMLRYIVCAGLLIAITMASPARAAIEAVAFLNFEDFGLFVDANGDGVPDGGPVTAGVHVTVLGPLFTSAASADIGSIPGGPVATATAGVTPTSLDTPIAQEGSAFADDSLFPLTNPAAPLPHAVADTATNGGAIIAGLGPAFGNDFFSTAQVDLSTANITDVGTADASLTNTASFTIVPLVPLTIVGIFDATRLLIADLTPSPPGAAATASTSFSVAITAAGVPVFTWAPDGVIGTGITGGTEFSDPFTLNSSLVTFPGTTATFSMTTTGALPPFAAGFTLLPGVPYAFTAAATVGGDALSFAAQQVIPEPSAVLVWALLALCAGGAAKYWLKR